VHQVAIQLGGFTIYWYGVFVAIGFLVGIWTASRRGLLQGIPAERTVDLGPWLIVGALVGARLFFVVSYWDSDFAQAPWYEMFMIRKGGLVYYGGFVGSSLAFLTYVRWKKIPAWRMADTLAPSIALGYFFGRFGCLMNGCCYGTECSLPWAIHFPYGHQTFDAGVHPAQVYDSLLNLGLYLGLAWLYRRKHFDGQVFATYLVGYAVLRFSVEFFRGDYTVHYLGGWATPAQVLSLVLFPSGIAFWVWQRRQCGVSTSPK